MLILDVQYKRAISATLYKISMLLTSCYNNQRFSHIIESVCLNDFRIVRGKLARHS
jgi:hypothetical protein